MRSIRPKSIVCFHSFNQIIDRFLFLIVPPENFVLLYRTLHGFYGVKMPPVSRCSTGLFLLRISPAKLSS
eukprot:UN02548